MYGTAGRHCLLEKVSTMAGQEAGTDLVEMMIALSSMISKTMTHLEEWSDEVPATTSTVIELMCYRSAQQV